MTVKPLVKFFDARLLCNLDWDCGRTVAMFEVITPIGQYRYYKVPEHIAVCDGDDDPDKDHVGEYAIFPPRYALHELDDEPAHYAADSIKANQWIHNDMADRIAACLKD